MRSIIEFIEVPMKKLSLLLLMFTIIQLTACSSAPQMNASNDFEKCQCRVAYMKALLKNKNAPVPPALSAELAAEIKNQDPCVLKRDIAFFESRLQDRAE